MTCPGCSKELDPVRHSELVCDGEVFCDGCRSYTRLILETRTFQELEEWNRRLCLAFDYEPAVLAEGEPPPTGPFDFLEEKKVLMAEADHGQGVITLYPAGLRLATLCHELAHLMTGEEHTPVWARTFARLVAWVKAQLPEDHYTKGFYVNLLK